LNGLPDYVEVVELQQMILVTGIFSFPSSEDIDSGDSGDVTLTPVIVRDGGEIELHLGWQGGI